MIPIFNISLIGHVNALGLNGALVIITIIIIIIISGLHH